MKAQNCKVQGLSDPVPPVLGKLNSKELGEKCFHVLST